MCIYTFWRGLLALGCTYLFLLCLPCHSKQSLLRSPDQSSVLPHCAHFVLFWLAILSCMALVHKLEQSVITKALHTLFQCLGVLLCLPINLHPHISLPLVCHVCHRFTGSLFFCPSYGLDNYCPSHLGHFTFVYLTVCLPAR